MMKAQTPKGGRIINIGSISAKTPRPDSLPYTMTKFGLQGMTHQLTMDGRKHNIVASIIHPGATLSSFTTRRGRTKAGPGETPEDYVMSGRGRRQGRGADGVAAAGSEPVRGDDPAEPHALVHQPGVNRRRYALTLKLLWLQDATASPIIPGVRMKIREPLLSRDGGSVGARSAKTIDHQRPFQKTRIR